MGADALKENLDEMRVGLTVRYILAYLTLLDAIDTLLQIPFQLYTKVFMITIFRLDMLIYPVPSAGEHSTSSLLETLNGLVPEYLTSKFILNGM